MLTRQESIKNFIDSFKFEFGFEPKFSGRKYDSEYPSLKQADMAIITVPDGIEFNSQQYIKITQFFSGYADAHENIYIDEIRSEQK